MHSRDLTTPLVLALLALALGAAAFVLGRDEAAAAPPRLFVDVHELGPGAVTAAAVAEAHAKDLEAQHRHGARFLRYWVDEAGGRVVCLSEAPSEEAILATHREAHGLIPDSVHAVQDGEEAVAEGGRSLWLDCHRLGPGAVTAAAVAKAHAEDLRVQARHDVRFLNYWVDEEAGVIWCLAEAPDADAMQDAHREAHGLVAQETVAVVQGE